MVVPAGYRLAAMTLSALMLPGTAFAGSTATRCDNHGCVHIHCNSTGDRCYRYGGDDERGAGAYCAACGENGRRSNGSGSAEGPVHRLCDSDGDRCYRSHEQRWNYREYYIHHGFHWES